MSLRIIEQQSCFSEELVDNGKNVQIHYVVKKTPFVVRLGVSKDSKVDFKNGRLDCELQYENNSKPVVVPDGGPSLEFVAHPSLDGKECSLDVRAYMLTTQANGIRFVVSFKLSKAGTAALTLDSHPLVVVSKQQQIRNKEAELERQREPHNARAKKRVRTEDVYGMLDEILNNQRIQADQLMRLGSQPPVQFKSEPSGSLSVEEALAALVSAYRRESLISGAQRAENLRRLVAGQDAETQQELRDIGFVLTAQSEFSHLGELNLQTDRSSSLSNKAMQDEHLFNTARSPFDEDLEMSDLAEPQEERGHWTPLNSLNQSAGNHYF